MDFIFKNLKEKSIKVYLDNILIHGLSFEDCYQLTNIVLKRLAQVQLTINIEKSQFFFRKLKYLNHIVSGGSLKPKSKRIEILQQRKKLLIVTDVCSLAGMLGYYQMYIKGYALLIKHIYKLFKLTENKRKKNLIMNVEWTAEMEDNVQEAIRQLSKAVLAIPIEGKEFLIETDENDDVVAAIL